MPGTREIRRRIRSINNTRQITRAMERVAAARLRRSQQRVLAARPYAQKMREVLADLAAHVGPEIAASHPLMQRREVRAIGVIVLTTDRGLCGALNSNTIRFTLRFLLDRQATPAQLVTVGRKGPELLRSAGVNIVAEFRDLGDRPTLLDTLPIVRIAMDGFADGSFDEVHLIYPQFVSTLVQRPTVQQILPLSGVLAGLGGEDSGRHPRREIEFIYEPNAREVLSRLLPRFVEIQVYQALLETIASEYSARMVAMRNATENATELLEELRLSYNKARQAQITREIVEIATGAQAVSR
ncbi:MAG: ATP synthase F1 subunit gamma [Chloroflexota bacterium]